MQQASPMGHSCVADPPKGPFHMDRVIDLQWASRLGHFEPPMNVVLMALTSMKQTSFIVPS